MHTASNTENAKPSWRGLYIVGGAAALIAGVLFRRNLGAEVSLFSPYASPNTVAGWFTLIQDHPLIGLAYLDFFDVIDYALLSLMFLGLYAALREVNRSAMTVAVSLGLVGAGVYFAANTTFSMFSLSEQYAAAASEAERSMLLAAGQAMLALNRSGAVHQGTGVYMSFLLLTIAGLIAAVVMLRSPDFGRGTASVGILAGGLDLTYCITFALFPGLVAYLLSAAGLLVMIWHVLIGIRLLRMARLGSVEQTGLPATREPAPSL